MKRSASSRGREPRAGGCPPLWPGNLRNDEGSTLDRVDWNAEIVSGDQLGKAVQQLKRQSGKGLFVGGVSGRDIQTCVHIDRRQGPGPTITETRRLPRSARTSPTGKATVYQYATCVYILIPHTHPARLAGRQSQGRILSGRLCNVSDPDRSGGVIVPSHAHLLATRAPPPVRYV
jgi:hypothetical protein